MLRQLSVHAFRSLNELHMTGLGRVNLLVGSNNCGKTSVLEAIQLLVQSGDLSALWGVLARRGEEAANPRRASVPEMDICHLFHGHEISLGSTFSVVGIHDAFPMSLTAKIVEPSWPPDGLKYGDDASTEGEDDVSLARPSGLALRLTWGKDESFTTRLTPSGGLDLGRARTRLPTTKGGEKTFSRVELITTAAMSADDTATALEEVILTENEDLLIRALRSIEPRIERIAPVGVRRGNGVGSGRGGVVVRLAGTTGRIPLGSMGDGMWRMLGIALSLIRARGGVLLVDEIDTGLHYTAMEEMWRLVFDAAQRFDVQVFAATHSRDCFQSLASIVTARENDRPEVTIQRIERGNDHAVSFTDDEIATAALIGAEVR